METNQTPAPMQTPPPQMDIAALQDIRAKRGFIYGLVSIVAWFIPLFGLPISILAIVFSSLGLHSNKKTKAVWGLSLGIFFLIISMFNSFLGMMHGYNKAMKEQSETQTQAEVVVPVK